MNKLNVKSKPNLIGLVLIIVLSVYNISIFVIFGFTRHKGAFWTSYIFMMISIVVASVCAYILKRQGIQPKDALVGLPFYTHCVAYIIIEFICSVLFMILDKYDFPWRVAFVIQIVITAIFVVLIVSCFAAKTIIEDVQETVKVNTKFMKNLLIEAEMIVERTDDSETKNAYSVLRDEIRYSDPVSNIHIIDIEDKMIAMMHEANIFCEKGDKINALNSCEQLMQLLKDRNRKCKLFKGHED